jgi:hypothetical protein
MIKKVLLLILLFYTNILSAEEPVSVKEIRNWYNIINDDLTGEEGLIQITSIEHNENYAPTPAVGPVTETIKYYFYNSSIIYYQETDQEYPAGPVKITSRVNAAGFIEYREYLFDFNGNLIFFFLDVSALEQERYYFKNRELVYLKIGDNENWNFPQFSEKMNNIFEEAEKIKQAFYSLPHVYYEENRGKFYDEILK